MQKDEITPIRQQYLDVKSQYPDSIVFFRLGDFYETFDHDAEITSRELDIVLTSRNVAKGVRIPMAGIPYHAVENYLSRLIEKGYHVAICEQIGEPPAKGLVHREVVRVVTPGTVIEPGLLRGDRNNYLASVVYLENRMGIAFVDITTGEFSATEIASDDILGQIRAEILRLNPAELLLPENDPQLDGISTHVTQLPEWRFEFGKCQQILLDQFEVATLDGFGMRGLPFAVKAAGAIVQYLKETQPAALKLLTHLSLYQLDDFMILDAATRRNLELTETIRQNGTKGSLLSVLDHTVTQMGHRLIRQWVAKPLLNIEEIEKRQAGVAFFLTNGLLRAQLFNDLKKISDLERLTSRVISGHAGPKDLISIQDTLLILPEIVSLFDQMDHPFSDLLQKLYLCEDQVALIQQAIVDDPPATLQTTGIIRPGYSIELDNILEASSHARDWIANLENKERERTGIRNLKVGFNKVFGYYIEITRSNTENAPEEYIRKQTLVNAERYITPDLKEYESLVLNAEERIREVEGRLFHQVCSEIASASRWLLSSAHVIAQLDVLASLAEAAAIGGYSKPTLSEGTNLTIIDGRHPVVEQTIAGDRFVPNDTVFEDAEIIRVITGPNMSGKSTFLRQVALISLMAQIGSFVPAKEASIGLVDRIFTRIGAQDEIHAGQSTFMVEMIETANILNHATDHSLLILDEIGRGTSTYDGLSIAWSVIEYIHNHPHLRSRTLFATHFHELTQLPEFLPGVRNYNVAVTEADNKVIFLHKIVPGGADRSYGIHVGQLAGLPKPVITRATEILKQLETTSGKATRISEIIPQQLQLFPENNPLLQELESIDINSISPIEALNRLYEWKKRFLKQ